MNLELDHIIGILSALFILSVVVEKFTQLIRSYTKRISLLGIALVIYISYSLYAVYLYELILERNSELVPKIEWVLTIYLLFYFAIAIFKKSLLIKKRWPKQIKLVIFLINKTDFWKASIILAATNFLFQIVFLWKSIKFEIVDLSLFLYLLVLLFFTHVLIGICFGFIIPKEVEKRKLFLLLFIPTILSFYSLSNELISGCLFYLAALPIMYFSLVALGYCKPIIIHYGEKKEYELRLFKRIAKGSNGECANKKAREISLLSFLVSCIVVVSLNNNLVNSLNGLSENHIALEFDVLSFPFEVDSYLRYDLKSNDLSEILIDPGQAFWLLVVAFFLTFGSQFFHDLIDRLYLLKEAKKGLANIRKNFQVEDRNHELELENRYFQMRDLNQEKNGVSDPTRLAVIDNEINKIAKRAKELTKEIYGN